VPKGRSAFTRTQRLLLDALRHRDAGKESVKALRIEGVTGELSQADLPRELAGVPKPRVSLASMASKKRLFRFILSLVELEKDGA